jgi:DNA repair protein RadC
MNIKSLPPIERPREKLMRYGAERLSSPELLAILLGTGTGGQNAVELARKILHKFHEKELATRGVDELQNTFGIGPGRAAEIVACFELGRRFLIPDASAILSSPVHIWNAMSDIRARRKEHFVAFYLNSREQLLEREVISVGTLTASLVHPREVFEPALRNLAAAIIVAHNHPSGTLEPSHDDLQITKQLRETGTILGIPVVDHIIVTSREYLSFEQCGFLP